MDNSGNNGNTVLLTVIGVATLLVALVGATFAYFSATISNNQNQSITVTTATPVSLNYVSANAISIENAIPGATDTKTFTVTNPSNSQVAQTYDLTLIIDKNQFNTTDGENQLKLTTTAASSGSTTISVANGNIDLTDGTTAAAASKTFVIVNDQKIEIGETQTYTVKLDFVETGVSQDNNQGKEFAAHIDISDAKSV